MQKRRFAIRKFLITALICGLSADVDALADLRDIKGPVISHDLPPFALTTLVLLLGGFLIILLRRRNLSPVTPEAAPASQFPSPDTITLLSADYLNGHVPVEILFTRLAALINGHLTTAAELAPAQLTTDEILLQTTRILTDQEQLQVTGVLQLCDRVKFAGFQPSDQEASLALNITVRILSAGARANS